MAKWGACRFPASKLGPAQFRGIVISLLLLFVAESSRGMVVSTLYGYMLSADHGKKSMADHYQPLAVSAFSFGRLIAAPVFGWAMDRWPCKWVIVLTIIVSVIGHGLYVFCGNISNAAAASCCIIAARAIVGLGSGKRKVHVCTTTHTRTHIAMRSLQVFWACAEQ
jgi:MFS family permease